MVSYSQYPFLLIGGLLPSFLWLLYYLRKDCHPEPKHLIARVFIGGIMIAPLAIIAQGLFAIVGGRWFPGVDVGNTSIFFLWAAFVEEVVKFLAVKYLILHNPEFDEPVDAMIYLIVAGLGFAAIENTLVLFRNIPDGIAITGQILLLRFFGATLLHALSSALLGYFLGLSWFYHHHSKKLLFAGIGIATIFHFTFNMFLVSLAPQTGVIFSSVVLVAMIILISFLFSAIKLRMTCQPIFTAET
ncbi:MAG: hypothetical protein A3A33_04965 [Candidatus Yanofskybacteria bacterium RIFCSPLOWO2_01_FULL_49_25]|uniref:Protease PrsW n=1 Tax=Candidatus Yanofskybacteria bacterium RIFCSPLOWO2_01_FULL_49_25 TaxID=1802701 RepID=A0A1F8GQ43_9BACT|nr:MAG: hypothetical protein A3A33_04965 [Candidatus Yanofskybacteria bacterium RIFCSPLOWO2_01_FULL_49_25]